jgi:hypothetical protein
MSPSPSPGHRMAYAICTSCAVGYFEGAHSASAPPRITTSYLMPLTSLTSHLSLECHLSHTRARARTARSAAAAVHCAHCLLRHNAVALCLYTRHSLPGAHEKKGATVAMPSDARPPTATTSSQQHSISIWQIDHWLQPLLGCGCRGNLRSGWLRLTVPFLQQSALRHHL